MVELHAPETCRLCKTPAQLQRSHIIPAFTFRWLKAAGHIRHSGNINKRVQDGATEKWLCSKCELLFNEWETKFCNEIFNPFCYGGALPSISYGDWLLKFCVSVSWRSLLYIREQAPFSHFNAKQVVLAGNALNTWSDVLLGKLKHPGKFEQHLIPFGPIRSIKSVQFPPNINRYLLRMIEIDAGANSSTAFIFTKLGRLGLLGIIELQKPEQWAGTKVRLRGGRIVPRNYVLPIQFGDYLGSRAQRAWDAEAKISSVQSKKIENTFFKNIDRFANSQLREAMDYDVKLFGDSAFRKGVASQ